MEKRHVLAVLLMIYVVLMIAGAIIPNPNAIPGFGGNTKIFHFLGFILLAILFLKTIDYYKFKKIYILGVIFIVLFAFITESLQLLVPTRHFLYTDMLIDIAGGLIGFGVYKWIFSKL